MTNSPQLKVADSDTTAAFSAWSKHWAGCTRCIKEPGLDPSKHHLCTTGNALWGEFELTSNKFMDELGNNSIFEGIPKD